MTDPTTPTRAHPTPPHDRTPDDPSVIVTCTTTHPLHDGDGHAFVFHLQSDPPYPTLIEVTSADPNRYRIGDRYTLTPPQTTGPARTAARTGLPARRPTPSADALRDGLAGKVGKGAPAALLAAVMDVLAACEPHRSTATRSVPVRDIDEAIAWKLRDYLPDRVSPTAATESAAAGTQTPS